MNFSTEGRISIADARTGERLETGEPTICLRLTEQEFRQLTEQEVERLLCGRWSVGYEIGAGSTLFVMSDKPWWRFLADCPQPVTLEQFRLVCNLTEAPSRTIEGKAARRALEFLHGLVGVDLRQESDWRCLPDSLFRIFNVQDGRNRLVVTLPQRARRLIERDDLAERVRSWVSKLAFGYEIYQR